MAAVWFCKMSGKELGPITSEQLRALIDKGRLRAEHLVKQGPDGRWVTVEQVMAQSTQDDSPWAAEDILPAAQPIKKPTIVAKAAKPRPAARTAAPAGKPAGAAAASDNLLEMIADAAAAEPLSKPTRRSSTSQTAELRKKQQTAILSGVLVAFCIAVGITIYVIFKSTSDPNKAKSGFEKAAASTGADSKAGSKEAEADAKKKSAAEEPKGEDAKPSAAPTDDDVKWTDAAAGTAQCGDVTIKIVSAVIGRVPLVSQVKESTSKDPALMITVELQNSGKKGKVAYKSWSLGMSSGGSPKLTDNVARSYPMRSKGAYGGYLVRGQLNDAPIEPSGTIEDILVFQRPINDGKVKVLRLTLPAAAFSEKGSVNFEIPIEMLKEGDETGKPAPKLPPLGQPPTGPPGTEDPNKLFDLEGTNKEGKKPAAAAGEGKEVDDMEEDVGGVKLKRQGGGVEGDPNAPPVENADPASKKPPKRKNTDPNKKNPAEKLFSKPTY